MTDAWDELLGPDAPRFRAALDETFERSEFGRIARQVQQDSEDRAFAQAEDRARSIFGEKFYNANRAAILNFALENNLADVDLAVRAWRGSADPSAVASEPTARSPIADMETRLHEMDARLEQLGLGDLRANSEEIRKVKWAREELQNDLALALIKGANDPDAHRQNLIKEENEASARSNAARTSRTSRGYTDLSSRESRDGRNARLEREALDMAQGRTAIPEEPKTSIPNAEALIEQELVNE